MAISAPTKSSQYTDYSASPRTMVSARDWGSKLRASYAKLTFTAAGFTTAAAGDLALVRMPPGKVRILVDQSWVSCPIGTATSDLDIGLGAYKDNTGATIALSGAQLADSLDVGAAAIDQALPLPAANGIVEVESQDGFDIVASFDTANSPAAGALEVTVIYQIGN
jgi:hypothetical protein